MVHTLLQANGTPGLEMLEKNIMVRWYKSNSSKCGVWTNFNIKKQKQCKPTTKENSQVIFLNMYTNTVAFWFPFMLGQMWAYTCRISLVFFFSCLNVNNNYVFVPKYLPGKTNAYGSLALMFCYGKWSPTYGIYKTFRALSQKLFKHLSLFTINTAKMSL